MDEVKIRKKPILTTHEAIMFREDVINQWHPKSLVWAFKYGDEFLGISTIFGGIYMTHKFRRELKLLPFARLTCYMPVVGLASVSCFLVHNVMISSQIIKSNKCPLCISTQASLVQVACGLAYPLLATTTVCFYLADKLLTYPVPPLVKAPREVFQLAKKIVLKNPRPYLILGAFHMIAGYFITFQKQQNLLNLELETRDY